MKKPEVVYGCQDGTEHFLGQEQVAEIRAAESAACQTVTTFFDRPRVGPVHGVPKLNIALCSETSCVAPITRWHDAVEEIDARGHGVQNILRAADPHQVTGLVGGQQVGCDTECLAHFLASFADADTADGVPVEIEGHKRIHTAGTQVGMRSPLYDAKESLVGPAVGRLAPPRPVDRPLAVARSGVSSSNRPSRCERNDTPWSVTRLRLARLNT
jgi:hypothetical protein